MVSYPVLYIYFNLFFIFKGQHYADYLKYEANRKARVVPGRKRKLDHQSSEESTAPPVKLKRTNIFCSGLAPLSTAQQTEIDDHIVNYIISGNTLILLTAFAHLFNSSSIL